MNTTHFYAVAPGRCRYLGSRANPEPLDRLPEQDALAPGEQLLAVPQQNQEKARRQAFLHAQSLITPDLLAWTGGSYLRALREAARLTLDGLQQASHVVFLQIFRLEHGEVTNPQYTTLALLAYALDVSLCDLLMPPSPPWTNLAPRTLPSNSLDKSAELVEWQGGPATRVRREASNLSQADLALVTGLKPNQISLIEQGKATNPRYVTLCRLALGLSTNVCELVTAAAPAPTAPPH